MTLLLERTEVPAPAGIAAARFGYIASRAIGVAVELDLFTHIDRGADRVDLLAEACQASPRGIRLLTDALVVQGLLLRQEGRLVLSAESSHWLVSDRPDFIGGMILHADAHWQRWAGLGQAVRSGTAPHQGVESDDDDGRYFAPFVASLHRLNQGAARSVAGILQGKVQRILDLGAGSGVWSLALAAADSAVEVVAVDRQEVLQDVTRRYAREAGCEQQFTFMAGNLREVGWENGGFDLVVIGHVLHSEGWERSRRLLKRVRAALKPGGRVLIAEMIPDETRSQDLYGVLFGLQMLMLTEEGDVFTRTELEQMLEEAGFVGPHWHETRAALYPLLLARRP